MKAAWSGWSFSTDPTPSIVVILSSSCMTARVRHELIRRPSTSTVQAPHCPWSQPFLVPVRSRCWRNASSKVVHGATVSLRSTPLTNSVRLSLAGVGNFSAGLAAALVGAIGFSWEYASNAEALHVGAVGICDYDYRGAAMRCAIVGLIRGPTEGGVKWFPPEERIMRGRRKEQPGRTRAGSGARNRDGVGWLAGSVRLE